jgi:thermosome
MVQQLAGQPILVLPEGAQRLLGRDAQRANIAVAKAVANAVQSTLGPRGMDKMLVDDLGDIVITNDGATILEEMNAEHPAAKMMVEVAKTQDEETGDGTTTAVVLAGELLKEAETMLDQQVHPSIIVRGYRMAAEVALKHLDEVADRISFEDDKRLAQIAITAMTGKGAEKAREDLAKMIVKAVKQVAEKTDDGGLEVDMDYIKLEKKQGGNLSETRMINGIVIDKERVHPSMPKRVNNAKIALLDSAMEVKETETDAEIRITSPDQLQSFLEQEEGMLRRMVATVKKSGADVLFCQKGIDDMAQHFLAKEGIFAVRRVKKSDMEKLAKATGGRVVTRLDDLEKTDLGFAKEVREEKISGEEMTFVEGCKNPKAVSILIRGGTEHVVDEAERAIHDGIGVVSCALEDSKIVPGGGSIEISIAMKLSEYAKKVGGREQLAIDAFARALEIIPATLAKSAGMDAIDTLVELRSRHQKKDKYAGVDVSRGRVGDMRKIQVVEPAKVKRQAITSASEAAEMILRIDDIIAASGKSREPPMPPGGGGMPGGMGGEF